VFTGPFTTLTTLDVMRIPRSILAGFVGYFIWASSFSAITHEIVEAINL